MPPARVIKSPQTARCGGPYNSIPILSKTPNTTGWRAKLDSIVRDTPVVHEAESSELVADPKTTGRRREQSVDTRGKELIAKRRSEGFESQTIKTHQAGLSSEPEESVGGLRQGNDVFLRALLEGPHILPDLQARCGVR
jgi:hypothetical protein